MKRDWNLIRDILIAIEQSATFRDVIRPNEIDGYSEAEVSYHIALLEEAGLVTAKCIQKREDLFCMAQNLTWQGHEFLDKVRENTTWQNFKQTLADKSISLSLESIKAMATYYIGQQLS